MQAQTPLLNTGEGIYGASYAAAAGVYKNLGYNPIGYDGVNNNPQHDLYVDDWSEGVNASNQALVLSNLNSHTHITARSEMLYATLVEGNGPFGSAFNRDDFTDKEVRDTDGDGLPEFVDAWGQPLQFYRWPTLYHSDLQRGQQYGMDQQYPTGKYLPPYYDPTQPFYNVTQEREQDTLIRTRRSSARTGGRSDITAHQRWAPSFYQPDDQLSHGPRGLQPERIRL